MNILETNSSSTYINDGKKQLALFYRPNNSTANALFELLKGLIPVQDKMYNLYKYEY